MQLFADQFKLTESQVKALVALMDDTETTIEIKGDGKAELLEPMTDEQFAQWEHENDRGWKKVYDRILRRG